MQTENEQVVAAEELEQNTEEKKDEKNPQSPTSGIADDFIERCLQNYFKNR